MLRDFGLSEFELELSMRDDEKDKWIGSDEFWEYSTNALRNVALESGLKLTEVPGEAAFYGPKIDLKTKDAIGRTWQLSTVQVDPNLPDRFELEYTDRDGQKKRPIMIHRALFGSIERFFAILLEHYAGAFPVWLSPVQVVGIPVAEEFADYLGEIIDQLKTRRRPRRARPQRRSDAEEDPHPHHPQGAAAAHRRRAGPVGRHGLVPVPRRIAGERRADRRGGAPHPVGHRLACSGEHRRGIRVTDGAPDADGADAQLIDAATLPGVPDEFQRLWTPHRMAYIKAGPEVLRKTCPFCAAPGKSRRGRADRRPRPHRVRAAEPLPVQLGPPAGLPVPPHRHVRPGDRRRGRRDRRAHPAGDAGAATVSRCDGFNIGMNQGSVAGAGIDEHLHQHIVPRWASDANFFPIIAKTKALPQLLGDVRQAVADAWDA